MPGPIRIHGPRPGDPPKPPPGGPPPAARPRRPKPVPGWVYGVLLLAGVLVGGAGFWVGGLVLSKLRGSNAALNDPAAVQRPAATNGPLDADEQTANDVFEAVKDSVVNVDTVVARNRFDLADQKAGTGSGFVWDTQGRIVTNYHVIQKARKEAGFTLRVVMADRKAYDAVVVGEAPDLDLAVIKIAAPADRLKPIPLATSQDLRVGQKVFAVGNPFDLRLTLTAGIISALDRGIESPTGDVIPGAIQHSAPINPGNSGGPLLNRAGKMIGVNTSIPATAGGGNVGIGFAIPADTVNQKVTEIVQNGRALRADLGLKLYDPRVVRRYGRGVMAGEVTPGGPAEKAGLEPVRKTAQGKVIPGDLIVAVNGAEVVTPDDFQRAVNKLKPGEPCRLKVVRGDDDQELVLTVGGS